MLKIENLTKHYPGSTKGVTDLSLHVEKGDLYAFIGHNGAGKTTTLKAIAGIHTFEKGEIYVDGISLRENPMACKERLAYIPDNPDLYEYLTGIQYLNFIADVYKIPSNERESLIADYADRLEITSALGDLISGYSHGMKQKLAILSALIHKPRLMILDEPFVGLDPKAAAVVKSLMHELCQSGGAVFFSTHVLEVAEKLCNKVAIIKGGKLVKSGRMEDIVGDDSLEEIFLDIASDGGSR